MKYVMFRRRNKEGLISFFPIIFPDHLIHKDIADVFTRKIGVDAVSAGDISFGMPACNGKSVSTGLTAHIDDKKIIFMGDAAAYMHDERADAKPYVKK